MHVAAAWRISLNFMKNKTTPCNLISVEALPMIDIASLCGAYLSVEGTPARPGRRHLLVPHTPTEALCVRASKHLFLFHITLPVQFDDVVWKE